MKFNLLLPASAGLCLLLLSLNAAPAQTPPNPHPVASAGPVDPATGMPLISAEPVDPATGMPLIAPDWKDPDITLANVDFDGLPVSEVAKHLRTAFKDNFDMVISPGATDPNVEIIDPDSVLIKLQLKNVTASEVFRAMNLLLQSENSPFRWHLLVNGQRPLVLFRTIPTWPSKSARHADQKQTTVFYVGDLIVHGGMTMKQITDTLADVNEKGYNGDIAISFHEETQVIIIKGTHEQIALVHDTLDALKQRIPKVDERTAQMEETKAALSNLSTFIHSLSKDDQKSDEPKSGDATPAK